MALRAGLMIAAFASLTLSVGFAGGPAAARAERKTPGGTPAATLPAEPDAAADAFAGVAPAALDPVARWRTYVVEASRRFGVPAAWIERVMRAESGGRTRLNGRAITSPAGAMGLMQLMPATWFDLRAELALGADPYDPRDNILAGTAYLAALYRRFGYPGLFGAYNAGPARYGAWLAGRGGLPSETRLYLAQMQGGSVPAALFAGRTAASPSASLSSSSAAAATSSSPTSALASAASSVSSSPAATPAAIARSLARGRLFAVDRGGGDVPDRPPPGRPAGRPAGLFVALSGASSRDEN